MKMAVDLELALHLVAKENKWSLARSDLSLDHVRYRVDSRGAFLATIHFTHGLEPPTRAIIENKPSDAEEYWPVARRSAISVTKALLEECADRGLVSDAANARAINELERYDREFTRSA